VFGVRQKKWGNRRERNFPTGYRDIPGDPRQTAGALVFRPGSRAGVPMGEALVGGEVITKYAMDAGVEVAPRPVERSAANVGVTGSGAMNRHLLVYGTIRGGPGGGGLPAVTGLQANPSWLQKQFKGGRDIRQQHAQRTKPLLTGNNVDRGRAGTQPRTGLQHPERGFFFCRPWHD